MEFYQTLIEELEMNFAFNKNNIFNSFLIKIFL